MYRKERVDGIRAMMIEQREREAEIYDPINGPYLREQRLKWEAEIRGQRSRMKALMREIKYNEDVAAFFEDMDRV